MLDRNIQNRKGTYLKGSIKKNDLVDFRPSTADVDCRNDDKLSKILSWIIVKGF